ncbi:MAG: hypothetical protein AAGK04_05065 [Planctomycetota bacterium]
MRRGTRFILMASACSAAAGTGALAQQSNPEQTGGWYRWEGGPPKIWSLSVEPAFYYVAPSGEVTMPGDASSDQVELSDYNVDDPNAAPFGEVHFRKDRWRLSVTGFTLDVQGSATIDEDVRLGEAIVLAGERVDTTLDFLSFEVLGSYRFAEYAGSQSYDGVYKFVTGAELVAGARYFDVGLEFDVDLSTRTTVFLLPSETKVDEVFAQPVVGLRWDMEFYEQFSVDVESTVGALYLGDHESLSWDIKAQFAWRPVENFGAFVGYRQVAFHLKDGDGASEFEWDGSLAGVFAGVQIRF